MGTKTLIDKYESVVNEYLKEFEKKQDLEGYFEYWTADEVGSVACYGDYFFNFDDIRIDIDYNIPAGYLLDYSDYCVINEPLLNYRSFLRFHKNISLKD